MKRKLSYTKPGAERRGFVSDSIETFHVTSEATLLPFLFEALHGRKATQVKNLLKHGQVAVNNVPVTKFDKALTPGDTVEINHTRPFVVFRHHRVRLVYEDDYIIVIDKGYGLLSVNTDKKAKETAYGILRDYLKLKNPANKIFVVHRLDRDTSGLMMFAKTIEAKEAMQHNWNNMVINRKYVAMVEGEPNPRTGIIRSYLKENNALEMYSVQEPEPDAKPAVTRYNTLSTANGYSIVELELDTGRKNQIRVHMKDIGTPIAGDRKYGARTSPLHRMALHASTLRFVHPITRKEMNFVSPAPFK